ncbi:MAG: M20/M25/M40 family metallo-hydrolase [Armatimonadetes bacterium]|nr:M20/M25/M40 family metallo-hydrolase [Armatimonadota bacterium]MDE2207506.1 M20/M25/M40 family metallo-hydrolase [Armatimonadota bacterium]
MRLAIRGQLDSALGELAALCAIPSVSARSEALEPCAELVAAQMREHGLQAEVMPTAGGPPIVFGSLAGRQPDAPTILLYNHYDVQPPEPLDLWESPPFELTIRSGVAFGRGVGDDKGHITSRLLTLDALRAVTGELPFNVKFLVEGEEEIGSPHLGDWILAHPGLLAADACIWEEGMVTPEGAPLLYCGMRGIACFELRCHTISHDAHSGFGGSILPNAAWRLAWALASLKSQDERIAIFGHYDTAVLPTIRDLQLLSALPNDAAEVRNRYVLPDSGFLGGRQTDGLEYHRRAVFEPSLTINGLDAGWQGPGSKTVLPADARAKIDFRLVPDQDPATVGRLLREHLDRLGFEDVESVYLNGQRPARVDPDHPWVRLAAETGEQVYQQQAAIAPMLGSSGPMWWFAHHLGLPIATPGIEYPGLRAHSPNENVRLDDFELGTLHCAHLLSRVGELPR